MRDDNHSSEEQFQMEDPVWRALNGVRLPEDEDAEVQPDRPASLKLITLFAIGSAVAFNIFRYFIMGD